MSVVALATGTLLALAACGGSPAGQAGADPSAGATPSAPVASSASTGAQAPTVTSAQAPDGRAIEARRRADAASDALVAGFWNGSAFSMEPHGDRGAPYWLNAQAFDAVLDGVSRTGGRWSDVARGFIAGQEARGWNSDYFDDENWMALALLRAADILNDPTLVKKAEALLDDIVLNGTDSSCCGAHAGGLWWDRSHTQKATASNAGPVITATRVYEKTGNASRLEFARKVFSYWLAEMVDPSTGQVADHVEPDGKKVWWRFTYNEGTMIGAALELYRATGEVTYLETAKRIGAFMLAHETASTSFGSVLFDGNGASCTGDCEQFKGIGQRYLAALADADPHGPWGALIMSDAEAIWNMGRDPATTTFGADWTATSSTSTVASQSSAVMGLSVAARTSAR